MISIVRGVDLAATEVAVYKNLNRGGWSITAVKGEDNRGLLLAHATELLLVDCRAVVKESRRQVIEAGGFREVCAWFIGRVVPTQEGHDVNRYARVTFRPRERATFFRTDTWETVTTAHAIRFDDNGDAWIC
jgi:hypothetical protein